MATKTKEVAVTQRQPSIYELSEMATKKAQDARAKALSLAETARRMAREAMTAHEDAKDLMAKAQKLWQEVERQARIEQSE